MLEMYIGFIQVSVCKKVTDSMPTSKNKIRFQQLYFSVNKEPDVQIRK